NADKLKAPPGSWADFWDTKQFPGKRGLRKGAKYTLEFALMADGVPRDQVYQVLRQPGGVDRAFRKLDQIKTQIQWWESGAQ
ncbi:extracellular solute-binding protein, partial [Stenotrophomonas maltophilia]|uniref:extracellular solute-binding protein n=1 Tax=Stenotrophomonas maltophilia TaxID=40324 RepID=UPI0031450770